MVERESVIFEVRTIKVLDDVLLLDAVQPSADTFTIGACRGEPSPDFS